MSEEIRVEAGSEHLRKIIEERADELLEDAKDDWLNEPISSVCFTIREAKSRIAELEAENERLKIRSDHFENEMQYYRRKLGLAHEHLESLGVKRFVVPTPSHIVELEKKNESLQSRITELEEENGKLQREQSND